MARLAIAAALALLLPALARAQSTGSSYGGGFEGSDSYGGTSWGSEGSNTSGSGWDTSDWGHQDRAPAAPSEPTERSSYGASDAEMDPEDKLALCCMLWGMFVFAGLAIGALNHRIPRPSMDTAHFVFEGEDGRRALEVLRANAPTRPLRNRAELAATLASTVELLRPFAESATRHSYRALMETRHLKRHFEKTRRAVAAFERDPDEPAFARSVTVIVISRTFPTHPLVLENLAEIAAAPKRVFALHVQVHDGDGDGLHEEAIRALTRCGVPPGGGPVIPAGA